MSLCELELRDFRNYAAFRLEPDPGVNLIVGRNAQGKTNLLEAIAYLGSGRSFRTQRGAEMVRFGRDMAELSCRVYAQEREQTMRAVVFTGGRKRQLYRNGVRQKSAGDMAGLLPTVLFCPEDLMVLRAGAAERRRLGDSGLCQLRPNYDAALGEYGRLLEQKSRILKDRGDNPSLTDLLPVFNDRLCRVGALLISYRARFYQSLGEAAAAYHRDFSGGAEEFSLQYRTVSTVKDPFAPVDRLEQWLHEHMQSHARAELDAAQCLSGPHKDDFDVTVSGVSLKAYGSQGQTRTAAISLKLALRELMAREWGQEPVLLLDDVLSELDAARQDFVLNRISRGQVFITCCEPGRFTKLGRTVEIEAGGIPDRSCDRREE